MRNQQEDNKYRSYLRNNPSKEECIVKRKLDQLKVKYIFQKGFYNGNKHCIVNFYLPKPLRVCIEIYGDNQEKLKSKGNDKYLIRRGLKPVRLNSNNVNEFNPLSIDSIRKHYKNLVINETSTIQAKF